MALPAAYFVGTAGQNRESKGMTPRFSPRTIGEFEDTCAGLVLRDIDRAFGDSGIAPGKNPREGGGQRRSRFREYLAGVDQRDFAAVQRLAEAFGWIMEMIERGNPDGFETLRRAAERDGFAYKDGQLRAARLAVAPFVAVEEDDLRRLGDQAVRLHALAMERPTDAIGGAKELVESVCKTVLRLSGAAVPGKGADLMEVVKATMKVLDLVPADVDEAKKGAEIVRKSLQQLGALVASLGELRNLYGSGHGRDGKWKGLGPRHARLAVGSAITVAEFIAETYLERADSVAKKATSTRATATSNAP